MASAVKKSTSKKFFESRKHFPEANDRINVVQFLEAAANLVDIIECFGKLFSPVKYDIQKNIDGVPTAEIGDILKKDKVKSTQNRRVCMTRVMDGEDAIKKIKKQYTFDENSCLLELMLDELKQGQNTAAEGVLWLNRSLWMFDLTFQEIIKHLQANNYNVSMKIIFTVAYEGSVKQYHNWVTQQVFHFICKMSPTLPEVMKTFHAEADNDVKGFESDLSKYNTTLHSVRCKIDDFFTANKLFSMSMS